MLLVIQEIYTIPINSARLKVSKGYASKVKLTSFRAIVAVNSIITQGEVIRRTHFQKILINLVKNCMSLPQNTRKPNILLC